MSIKIVKNKVAPPFKVVELDLIFSEGISKELDLLDASLHFNVIKQNGSWFAFEDANFAQGRDQALQCLKADAVLTDKITASIHKAIAAEKTK